MAAHNGAFPSRLEVLRKSAGLSQTELAEKLGCSRGSVSFYELGQRVPDIETLTKIAHFFSVSTDYLLGLSITPDKDYDIENAAHFTGLSALALNRLASRRAAGVLPSLIETLCTLTIDGDLSAWETVEDYIAKAAATGRKYRNPFSSDEVNGEDLANFFETQAIESVKARLSEVVHDLRRKKESELLAEANNIGEAWEIG